MHFQNILAAYRLAIPVIASLTLLLALAGCGDNKQHEGHDEHENHQHSNHEHSETPTSPATSAVIDAGQNDYPLTTCIVSGEDLDAMGGHVSIQHEGREVRFCCKDCVKQFKENPAKYIALLDKAASGQPITEHDTNGYDDHDHSGHEH